MAGRCGFVLLAGESDAMSDDFPRQTTNVVGVLSCVAEPQNAEKRHNSNIPPANYPQLHYVPSIWSDTRTGCTTLRATRPNGEVCGESEGGDPTNRRENLTSNLEGSFAAKYSRSKHQHSRSNDNSYLLHRSTSRDHPAPITDGLSQVGTKTLSNVRNALGQKILGVPPRFDQLLRSRGDATHPSLNLVLVVAAGTQQPSSLSALEHFVDLLLSSKATYCPWFKVWARYVYVQ